MDDYKKRWSQWVEPQVKRRHALCVCVCFCFLLLPAFCFDQFFLDLPFFGPRRHLVVGSK